MHLLASVPSSPNSGVLSLLTAARITDSVVSPCPAPPDAIKAFERKRGKQHSAEGTWGSRHPSSPFCSPGSPSLVFFFFFQLRTHSVETQTVSIPGPRVPPWDPTLNTLLPLLGFDCFWAQDPPLQPYTGKHLKMKRKEFVLACWMFHLLLLLGNGECFCLQEGNVQVWEEFEKMLTTPGMHIYLLSSPSHQRGKDGDVCSILSNPTPHLSSILLPLEILLPRSLANFLRNK
jgi:hypothetical protein